MIVRLNGVVLDDVITTGVADKINAISDASRKILDYAGDDGLFKGPIGATISDINTPLGGLCDKLTEFIFNITNADTTGIDSMLGGDGALFNCVSGAVEGVLVLSIIAFIALVMSCIKGDSKSIAGNLKNVVTKKEV